ncbi:MAG TPA: sugar phosphate nucleotidyltransferase [Candidatus Baltobacteraceae bacterium]|nr:sugar phosphate nucleotidyltransferase [Candidatus Baltobacteraceae bacterium]
MYAILLAGGSGTRLWPVSRKSVPKQLQPILGADTLLRSTWKRLRKGLPASRILVVTGASQAELIRQDLPELPTDNLLVEPMKRDTAAAIGFGVATALARDSGATIATINSDADVKDEKEFWRVLKVAEKAAKKSGRIALVGVRPSYPETGYGYIKMGSQAMRFKRAKGHDEIFDVEGFREKPDLETAKAYVAQWEYLWNPTLIVAEAKTLMGAFKAHLPKTWKILSSLRTLERNFAKIEPISIDYGVLEKEKRMLVVPADFGWADVGHWRAVHDVLAKRPGANVTRGRNLTVDSEGNLLYSFTGKLIAAAGLKDMILIETEDVILACPKSRAQDVKKLVEEIERKKMKKYL